MTRPRDQLLQALFDASPLMLSRDDFAASLEGWDLEPVEHEGQLAGVFAVNGPEFHFCKFDRSYQAGRAILRRFPGELIARHGYAITRTPKDDFRQQRFNVRLGARVVNETEHDIVYRFERDRFAQRG